MSYSSFLCSYGSGSDPIKNDDFSGGSGMGNKLFSFITQNGRGKPLISHEVIVSLIAATTTQKALHVECDMDKKVGSSLF